MNTTAARVSVGLPVYNGQRFLEEAIDSILAQTFTDFELIISDNGSTDNTHAICTSYARRDCRIRYLRNDLNRGGAWNYNNVFAAARGEYFKWAAHDDVLSPKFLERCVEALDSNPNAVLSYTETTVIDENGVFISALNYMLDVSNINASTRLQNYFNFFWHVENFHCNPVFGLIRTEVLRKTSVIGNFVASDRTLLAELALHGPFQRVPEHLFLRRDHADRSMHRYKGREAQAVWFNPENKGKIMLPNWRWCWEYLCAIKRVPMSLREKLLCSLITLKYCRPRQLAVELKSALRQIQRRRRLLRTGRGSQQGGTCPPAVTGNPLK